MTGYFVADNAYGEPTLWRGDEPDGKPVVAQLEVDPVVWSVLVGVLTDEAVERIARALFTWDGFDSQPEGTKEHYRKYARKALAAVRGEQ